MNKQFLLLAVGCLVLSVVLLAIGVPDILRARASTRWPSAQGRIVSSDIIPQARSHSQSRYQAKVVYEYAVGGKNFTSTRVRVGDLLTTKRRHAQRVVDRYRPGDSVRVYYSPNDPGESLLQPGVQPQGWVLPGTGVGVASLSLVFLVAARRRVPAQNRESVGP